MELPYTDDWKQWLDVVRKIPVEGYCIHPIQHPVNLTWNVFKPNTMDWMVVSNPEFMDYVNPNINKSEETMAHGIETVI